MGQQGARHYLGTIRAEIEAHSALSVTDGTGQLWTNAELVAELSSALDNGNLEYAMVNATEGKVACADAILEYFKI